MREIKFRAFSYGKRYLIYPEDFEWFGGTGGAQRTLTECDLMQYTGLKDKNGKEIYEGDIISCLDGDLNFIGEIKFMNGCFWTVNKDGGAIAMFIWLQHKCCKIEVIGNIYENPELLEVKQ